MHAYIPAAAAQVTSLASVVQAYELEGAGKTDKRSGTELAKKHSSLVGKEVILSV